MSKNRSPMQPENAPKSRMEKISEGRRHEAEPLIHPQLEKMSVKENAYSMETKNLST
jgi:hypothetical protein